MKKTRHALYYIHDDVNEIVYIIAIWAGPKGSDPTLRDPR